jgi:anti-sigma regulatory factor (Ser/Thr protein kinase)
VPRTQQLTFLCASDQLCSVRRLVESFLAEESLTPEELGLITLAIDEACANVLRHAYHGSPGKLHLRLQRLATRLRVTLRDFGTPCDPQKIRSRDLTDFRPGGLGVFLMQQAFPKVEFTPLRDGTRLLLERPLPRPAD